MWKKSEKLSWRISGNQLEVKTRHRISLILMKLQWPEKIIQCHLGSTGKTLRLPCLQV
jgi:hypothetical protein